MRRSLGGGRGRPMGGGGGTIRAFQRAVNAAPNTTANIGGGGIANKLNKKKRGATSPSPSTTALTLFSPSFSSTVNIPISAASAPAWISSSSSADESEWEYVHSVDDETAEYVFGTVPSTDEVNHALSALQQALGSSSSSHVSSPKAKRADCEVDWVEPSHNLYSSKALQRPTTDVVSDTFHLLETEPSVQRMVVSLSSDQAVWDAVLNNEVVRELRGSIHKVASLVGESESSSDPHGQGNILSWVVMFAKSKMLQLLDLVTKLVNNVVGTDNKGDDDHGLDGKVKSSFFLSIIVLLLVILGRTKTTTNA